VRRKPTFRRHRRGVRPALQARAIEVVLRLAKENLRSGCLRIRGELVKLGSSVSATVIRTLARRPGLTLGAAPQATDLV